MEVADNNLNSDEEFSRASNTDANIMNYKHDYTFSRLIDMLIDDDDIESAVRVLFDDLLSKFSVKEGFIAISAPGEVIYELRLIYSEKLQDRNNKIIKLAVEGSLKENLENAEILIDNNPILNKEYEKFIQLFTVINNLLFAPFSLRGDIKGFIFIINKVAGFTEEDALFVEDYSKYFSIALYLDKKEKEIISNKKILTDSQRLGKMGYYIYDILNDKWISSKSLDLMFGIDESFPRDLGGWLSLIHPSRRDEMRIYLKEKVIDEKQIFGKEYPIINPLTGEEKWLYGRGELQLDDKGRSVRMFGAIQDISERKAFELSLLEKKNIFEKIYQGLSEGIVIIDNKTNLFTDINKSAEDIFGYSNSEIKGMPISTIHPMVERISDRASVNKSFNSLTDIMEIKSLKLMKRKSGEIFPVDFELFPITDENEDVIRYVGIVRDIGSDIISEKEREISKRRLHSFATHLQNIREDERISIAREIHDEIGQTLSALKINLVVIEQQYLNNSDFVESVKIKKEIESMKEYVSNTIRRMRNLVTFLRPEVIEDLVIHDAIEWLVDEFKKSTEIPYQFVNNIRDIEFDKDVSLALFRIVQEGLKNIERHSQANNVKIELSKENNRIILLIEDDGIGYDMAEVNSKETFGLIGIRERASVLNASIDIQSELGSGVRIKLSFIYNLPKKAIEKSDNSAQ